MSASQIPNLLSLRGGPRSRGGRARGSGRGQGRPFADPDHAGPASARHRKDVDIQSTDTDAAVSRLSAVGLGYLDDPFASYFVTGNGTRRLPIINRGTYTRTTALDTLINAFLGPRTPEMNDGRLTKQIISVGAGTDTRYFRLRAADRHHNLIYHEFDFPAVAATKQRIVTSNQLLIKTEEDESLFPGPMSAGQVSQTQTSEWGITRSKNGLPETIYCFHSLDLRELPCDPPKSIHGLRTDVPTLIISECCLCYMEVESSRDIVKWFADKIPSLSIILYEPIGIEDSFGQMMVANLAARNITMPSLKLYKTLSDQKQRLSELGFKDGGGSGGGQGAETVENIWEEWVPSTEKDRVDRLEGLDEVEEWQMLARHYAVVWGWRGVGGLEAWDSFQDRI